MDPEIVIRAQGGDAAAYTVLATRIADRFLSVARRILRDVYLAEDATQQALVSVWRELPRLREPERFDAWAYRILVHACYAEGRHHRRWEPSLRWIGHEAIAPDTLDAVADRDQIARGFRRLSIDHRTVIVLHYYLDLPLDQVAEILRIPEGTAHSRLHHAMRSLRAALDADLRAVAREVI